MDNSDVIELNPITVQDLVVFCKRNNISTDAVIVLDMGKYARPFTFMNLSKGKDGKAAPIIELK